MTIYENMTHSELGNYVTTGLYVPPFVPTTAIGFVALTNDLSKLRGGVK